MACLAVTPVADMQKNLRISEILLRQLCDAGYEVSREANGALTISGTDHRVSRVVDLKTPGSTQMGRNRYENIGQLTTNDQVKFVICSREEYDWSVSKAHQIPTGCTCGRSTVFAQSWAD